MRLPPASGQRRSVDGFSDGPWTQMSALEGGVPEYVRGATERVAGGIERSPVRVGIRCGRRTVAPLRECVKRALLVAGAAWIQGGGQSATVANRDGGIYDG